MASSGNLGDIYKERTRNTDRSKWINGLPPEYQDYYKDGDRFTIQNASLAFTKTKVYSNAEFIRDKKIEIPIFYYEGVEEMTAYARSCLIAYSLYMLYSKEWQDDPNPCNAETLSVVLTVLATYMPYEKMVENGLESVLSRCNMVINRKRWVTLESMIAETLEVREAVAELAGVKEFDHTPQVFLVIGLSILILIGKNVTELSRDGWFRNRWKALAFITNVTIEIDRLEPPLLKPCQAVYTTSSAYPPIRRYLFNTIRSLAGIVDNSRHAIFDRIVRLLQWAEMSHMWMIVEYIFQQNPDLLNFPELRGAEIAPITVAIAFLKKFPKEERPYLKLLYDHNDLTPLHSTNFIHFTAAAHAVAALTKSSMLNITSRFSENVKTFQCRVSDYIQAKAKIGPLAAAVHYGSIGPVVIQKKLMLAIESATISRDIPDFEDQQPEARE